VRSTGKVPSGSDAFRRKGAADRADGVGWIYRRLLRRFGPQGWWPVTPSGGRQPRYSRACTRGRLTAAQRFEVAAGAILTQNTAWTNVEKALEKLNAARALSPRMLASMPLPRLYRLIRSSGYFRQKSRRLKGFARFLVEEWDGRLDAFLDRPTEAVRRELLALEGVGPETADSILLYAGGHPVFVVDAYTRRLGTRFGLFRGTDYHDVQRFFMERTKPSLYDYREYHALIVEAAKRHCRTKPLCGRCPVWSRCSLGRKNARSK
jgi:endonuclease III related protein